MTTQSPNPPSRQCPVCGQRLVFSSDGRYLQCETCGHQQRITRPRRRPQEIARRERRLGERSSGQDLGILLAQGIAACKEGNLDEAFFCLEQVLIAGGSENRRALAWYWLSEVYDDPADKRECLEQVLVLEPTNALARRGMAILDGRLDPEHIVDPEQLPPVAAGEAQTAQAEQFACPRCHARMNYTVDGRALLCQFCHYRQELDGQPAVQSEFGIGGLEQDFVAALATKRGHIPPVAMRVLQCQGCAVEFVLAPETLSVTCPYCNSVYVTAAAETHDIHPPQALLPFTISQDDARQALRAWFKQQKIQHARISPIVGIYLPVWTFDVSGQMQWHGLAREEDGMKPHSGFDHLFYDDWLVSADKKLPDDLAKGLDDFDLNQLVPYDTRYLADWPAERYQVTLADASILARKQIVQAVQRRPAKHPGNIIFDVHISPHGLTIESFKLILLPFWMVHYRVTEGLFDVIINGQTGAVRGQKPPGVVGKLISWLKGA